MAAESTAPSGRPGKSAVLLTGLHGSASLGSSLRSRCPVRTVESVRGVYRIRCVSMTRRTRSGSAMPSTSISIPALAAEEMPIFPTFIMRWKNDCEICTLRMSRCQTSVVAFESIPLRRVVRRFVTIRVVPRHRSHHGINPRSPSPKTGTRTDQITTLTGLTRHMEGFSWSNVDSISSSLRAVPAVGAITTMGWIRASGSRLVVTTSGIGGGDGWDIAAIGAGTVTTVWHFGHGKEWPAFRSAALSFAPHLVQEKLICPFIFLARIKVPETECVDHNQNNRYVTTEPPGAIGNSRRPSASPCWNRTRPTVSPRNSDATGVVESVLRASRNCCPRALARPPPG